jgi:hypothetical protein
MELQIEFDSEWWAKLSVDTISVMLVWNSSSPGVKCAASAINWLWNWRVNNELDSLY